MRTRNTVDCTARILCFLCMVVFLILYYTDVFSYQSIQSSVATDSQEVDNPKQWETSEQYEDLDEYDDLWEVDDREKHSVENYQGIDTERETSAESTGLASHPEDGSSSQKDQGTVLEHDTSARSNPQEVPSSGGEVRDLNNSEQIVQDLNELKPAHDSAFGSGVQSLDTLDYTSGYPFTDTNNRELSSGVDMPNSFIRESDPGRALMNSNFEDINSGNKFPNSNSLDPLSGNDLSSANTGDYNSGKYVQEINIHSHDTAENSNPESNSVSSGGTNTRDSQENPHAFFNISDVPRNDNVNDSGNFSPPSSGDALKNLYEDFEDSDKLSIGIPSESVRAEVSSFDHGVNNSNDGTRITGSARVPETSFRDEVNSFYHGAKHSDEGTGSIGSAAIPESSLGAGVRSFGNGAEHSNDGKGSIGSVRVPETVNSFDFGARQSNDLTGRIGSEVIPESSMGAEVSSLGHETKHNNDGTGSIGSAWAQETSLIGEVSSFNQGAKNSNEGIGSIGSAGVAEASLRAEQIGTKYNNDSTEKISRAGIPENSFRDWVNSFHHDFKHRNDDTGGIGSGGVPGAPSITEDSSFNHDVKQSNDDTGSIKSARVPEASWRADVNRLDYGAKYSDESIESDGIPESKTYDFYDSDIQESEFSPLTEGGLHQEREAPPSKENIKDDDRNNIHVPMYKFGTADSSGNAKPEAHSKFESNRLFDTRQETGQIESPLSHIESSEPNRENENEEELADVDVVDTTLEVDQNDTISDQNVIANPVQLLENQDTMYLPNSKTDHASKWNISLHNYINWLSALERPSQTEDNRTNDVAFRDGYYRKPVHEDYKEASEFSEFSWPRFVYNPLEITQHNDSNSNSTDHLPVIKHITSKNSHSMQQELTVNEKDRYPATDANTENRKLVDDIFRVDSFGLPDYRIQGYDQSQVERKDYQTASDSSGVNTALSDKNIVQNGNGEKEIVHSGPIRPDTWNEAVISDDHKTGNLAVNNIIQKAAFENNAQIYGKERVQFPRKISRRSIPNTDISTTNNLDTEQSFQNTPIYTELEQETTSEIESENDLAKSADPIFKLLYPMSRSFGRQYLEERQLGMDVFLKGGFFPPQGNVYEEKPQELRSKLTEPTQTYFYWDEDKSSDEGKPNLQNENPYLKPGKAYQKKIFNALFTPQGMNENEDLPLSGSKKIQHTAGNTGSKTLVFRQRSFENPDTEGDFPLRK